MEVDPLLNWIVPLVVCCGFGIGGIIALRKAAKSLREQAVEHSYEHVWMKTSRSHARAFAVANILGGVIFIAFSLCGLIQIVIAALKSLEVLK